MAMAMALTRRALVILVASLVGAGVTARLGVWQLDRAAQKNALQAALDGRRMLPPLATAELAATEVAASEQHYRPAVLEGRWIAERTVYLDNRQMNGLPGFYVVTPLLLADGTAVLVQRGWEQRNFVDRSRVVAPATSDAVVRVAGHIAPPPGRLFDFAGADSGLIRQNLDLAAYAAEIHRPLRPLSLVQEDGPLTPPDGLLRQWPRPAADVQKHYGYAFQWFAMATLILGLYVWFQLIRPRQRR
jgi:surfeit locus 1 family protein